MNLIDVTKQFATEEQCLNYLEKMRWPKGVRCPVCGSESFSRIEREAESKNKRNRFYQCLEPSCKHQFSATAGTIFHDSHLPLTKWFMAVAMIVDAKKGVSALQLGRHLGLIKPDPKNLKKKTGYKTAWYLAHRIRKAMEDSEGSLLKGTVEVDECYIGGKYDPRRKRGKYEKAAVIGMVERGGRVRTMKLNTVSKETLVGTIEDNTARTAHIMTDEHAGYKAVKNIRRHDSVNHIKEEWVRGACHTNTIENYWSLLKRGIIGSFHQVSVKHLDRYLSEFEYRQNNRKEPDLFIKVIGRMCGTIPMPMAQLTADPDANQPF
jgi:transposase-like protein